MTGTDPAGGGLLECEARLAFATHVTVKSSFDAGGAADDPIRGEDSLGADFQVAAGVHRAGGAGVDRDFDEFDGGVAAGADGALSLLRDHVRAAALEAMDRARGFLFFPDEIREFAGTGGADAFGRGLVVCTAGPAVRRDEMGRLKLHETAHRTPER